MAINKTKKKEILETLIENFKNTKSVAFTSNNGLNVDEISDLRNNLREVKSTYMLAKKTLIKIAFKKVYDIELEDSMLDWQIALLFSFWDEVAWLWKIHSFIKEVWEEKIKWSGSFIDGKINSAEDTKALAKLPSKEVLLWQLVWTMQAPISKFVWTLDATVSWLVRLLSSAKDEIESKWKEKVGDLIA